VLKDLIELGAVITGCPAPEWVHNCHDLLQLWTTAKKSFCLDQPRDAAEAVVENRILEFSEIDAHSFAFRYPTDRHGTPYLPQALAKINLRNFSEVLEKIHIFLGATYDYQYETWHAMPRDETY